MKKSKTSVTMSELDNSIIQWILNTVTYTLNGITCDCCEYYVDKINKIINPNTVIIFAYDSETGKVKKALIKKGLTISKSNTKFALLETDCKYDVLIYKDIITVVLLSNREDWYTMEEKHDRLIKTPLKHMIKYIISQKTETSISDIDYVYNNLWNILDITNKE